MTVSLRSNVLRRDEKGLFGIPFKRLLVAGMGGGAVMVFTQTILGSGVSMVLAVTAATSVLILTASRGGIPAWRRVMYGLQARFMLAAARPGDLLHPIAQLFSLTADRIILDSTRLFGAKEKQALTRPAEWVVYGDLKDEAGLTLVESPAGAVVP